MCCWGSPDSDDFADIPGGWGETELTGPGIINAGDAAFSCCWEEICETDVCSCRDEYCDAGLECTCVGLKDISCCGAENNGCGWDEFWEQELCC